MGAVYPRDRARDRRARGAQGAARGVGEARERFAREARCSPGCGTRASCATSRTAAPSDGEPYLAMEWLDGEGLAPAARARRRSRAAESVALVRRVAEALGAAHARGVVHRDVKPTNLFLADGDVDARQGRSTSASRALGRDAARRRAPASWSARPATWRPSRRAASATSTRAPTCSRSAACCSSASPGSRRSSART